MGFLDLTDWKDMKQIVMVGQAVYVGQGLRMYIIFVQYDGVGHNIAIGIPDSLGLKHIRLLDSKTPPFGLARHDTGNAHSTFAASRIHPPKNQAKFLRSG